MATGRRDVLENKVRRAIQQEQQGSRRPKLLNSLKPIQAKLASMQWVWEANDGNGQEQRLIRYEYLQMLEAIATVLTGLGAEFGIPDLEFLGHPSKYAEQDSDGKTRLKQEYRNKVRTWFYPNSYRSNVNQWKKTRLATLEIGAPSGHFKDEMTGKFEPINVPGLATNVTIDRINPGVSRHWNMDNGGHNQKQEQRADFYNETSNMRLVAHKNNSSDGSRNAPAYNPEVGPNFRGPDDNL